MAVRAHLKLSETFAIFGGVRGQQNLSARFESPEPTPRRFYLRDFNLGVTATLVERSTLTLQGRLSADLPTSEMSRAVGRILAPIAGLSLEKTMGKLQLRAMVDARTNLESKPVDSFGPGRPLDWPSGLFVTEAYSLRTTAIGTYTFDSGFSVSAGLSWATARLTSQYFRGVPVFAAAQVDVWASTQILGLQLGYRVTEVLGLAMGYSAVTSQSAIARETYRDSNPQPLQSPYFFSDAYGWSAGRFYLSAAFTY